MNETVLENVLLTTQKIMWNNKSSNKTFKHTNLTYAREHDKALIIRFGIIGLLATQIITKMHNVHHMLTYST